MNLDDLESRLRAGYNLRMAILEYGKAQIVMPLNDFQSIDINESSEWRGDFRMYSFTLNFSNGRKTFYVASSHRADELRDRVIQHLKIGVGDLYMSQDNKKRDVIFNGGSE